ncbi:MAG: conjugal transfer protein TraR, partial [Syntrophomonadaceae bacterium]|nr:conjugal transfer protein TraR [Syntrophomonadaceae bacterium]
MLQSIYKQRLLAERDRLDNSINQKIAASTESLSEMTDELSMYDQHSADLGSETFEREKDAGLQEMLENELVKVNDALRR